VGPTYQLGAERGKGSSVRWRLPVVVAETGQGIGRAHGPARLGEEGGSPGRSRPAWQPGPAGLKSEEKIFSEKNCIIEFTKALKIYTSRFRRNFDVGIFSKFFKDPQGFLENTICHAMNATLSQIKLRKSFLRLNFSKNAN
jgi:hypothetical protein